MVITQQRSQKKVTGGRYKKRPTKRLAQLAGEPALTKLGKKQVKTLRVHGGNQAKKSVQADTVNCFDKKTKKSHKLAIEQILENPANRHFIRRNIMTKGTIIKTKMGKAKITSRPGQEAALNAVLI